MKARSRIKVNSGDAVYHCISRVVAGERLWDDSVREMMRKQLWRVAEFSGVEILTYCLMSNHFHVLVRVPDRSGIVLTDAELIRRYKLLYPQPTAYETARVEVLEQILRENGTRAEAFRRKLLARMHDVSEFMKTFKQRFSIWYNRTHNRFGTHWSERFTSVLVEGGSLAALTVAAYIDLNPVRAGLVNDPKDYRWCGYAEAVAGKERARQGIATVVGFQKPRPGRAPIPEKKALATALAQYRTLLFGKGAGPAPGKQQAASISPEEANKVLRAGGKLPLHTLLHCRARYFTAGLILGSRAFVQSQLEERLRRGEIRRKPRPRPIPVDQDMDLAIGKGIHLGK